MSRITVSFDSDRATDEQSARDLVDGIAYEAGQRGIRNLSVDAVSSPVTFADHAAFEAAAREWARSNANL